MSALSPFREDVELAGSSEMPAYGHEQASRRASPGGRRDVDRFRSAAGSGGLARGRLRRPRRPRGRSHPPDPGAFSPAAYGAGGAGRRALPGGRQARDRRWLQGRQTADEHPLLLSASRADRTEDPAGPARARGGVDLDPRRDRQAGAPVRPCTRAAGGVRATCGGTGVDGRQAGRALLEPARLAGLDPGGARVHARRLRQTRPALQRRLRLRSAEERARSDRRARGPQGCRPGRPRTPR